MMLFSPDVCNYKFFTSIVKIEYRSKEESNSDQEKEFLQLTPVERIYSFLNLMVQSKGFPTKAKTKKDNFLIEIVTSK